MCLDARAYSPNELIYHEGDLANEMFIVQKGLAATKGFVISEGMFFGEDFVLPGARRVSDARALTYLATYGLIYDDPEIEKYGLHQTRKLIRKKAIQLAVRHRFTQILMLARASPGYKAMTKEDVQAWKDLNQAKTYLKMHEKKLKGGKCKEVSLALVVVWGVCRGGRVR